MSLLEQLTLVKSRTWDNPQRPLGNLASASLRLWQARRSDEGRAGKQNSDSQLTATVFLWAFLGGV